MKTLPLEGVKVVDLSRVLAGPHCSMALGDLGAHIIKVERSGSGDDTRGWGPPFASDGESAYFLSTNRNKLSLAADFRSASDVALLHELIAGADIVIENFLPGVLARYSFDADLLLAQNTRLIWCTISGFGPSSMRPGYDFVVQAESGWMAITGEPDGAPMKTGVALVDLMAGKDAAIDTGDGAGMNLMDIRKGDWAPAALAATAPDLATKLPPVRPGSTVAGGISAYFVARHGFSPKCQVVIGTGDNPSSLVGMGASKPGKVVISLGTSDTLFAAIEGIRTDSAGLGHAFGNPMGGSMSLVCVRNGSLAREAIRRECGHADWPAFSAAVDATPPAVSAVLPMEEPEITPRRPAGRIALGAAATQATLPRAAVEGQALSLRYHSRWVGTPTTQLLLTGGASENPSVAKIFADVFGAPVLRLAVSDSAALGAALRAAEGACGAKMADLEPVFCAPAPGVVQPNPALRAAYDKLEAELGQSLSRKV